MDYQGFGNGQDGVAVLSGTDAPKDSTCSGTSGTTSLAAADTTFTKDRLIFIHQSRGVGCGNYEFNVVNGYSAGVITTAFNLVNTYADSGDSQAQVIEVKEYSSVEISSTFTGKAWDGDKGGILMFLCNGTTTISGTCTVKGKGFRGGQGYYSGNQAIQNCGEGSQGASSRTKNTGGSGGGGGQTETNAGANDIIGGAGGGNGTAGNRGTHEWNAQLGDNVGGTTSGSADLTTMTFGGGGGCSGADYNNNGWEAGAPGGGIVLIWSALLVITGYINADGNDPANAAYVHGGAGAGGSINLRAQIMTLTNNHLTAIGGISNQGEGSESQPTGWGNAGVGRIHLEACEITGTTTPSADEVEGGCSWCVVPGSIY